MTDVRYVIPSGLFQAFRLCDIPDQNDIRVLPCIRVVRIAVERDLHRTSAADHRHFRRFIARMKLLNALAESRLIFRAFRRRKAFDIDQTVRGVIRVGNVFRVLIQRENPFGDAVQNRIELISRFRQLRNGFRKLFRQIVEGAAKLRNLRSGVGVHTDGIVPCCHLPCSVHHFGNRLRYFTAQKIGSDEKDQHDARDAGDQHIGHGNHAGPQLPRGFNGNNRARYAVQIVQNGDPDQNAADLRYIRVGQFFPGRKDPADIRLADLLDPILSFLLIGSINHKVSLIVKHIHV